MLPTLAALVTAAAFGAADLRATNHAFADLPAFVARAAPVVPGAFTLHSPMLDAQALARRDADARDAQHRRHHHGGSTGTSDAAGDSTAAPAGDDAAPASGTAPAAPATGDSAPATTTGSAAAPASAPAAAGAAPAASAEAAPADDAAAAPADDEPDIELIRHREHQVRTHRLLGFTTLGSLVVTEVLGTLLAINEGTLFSHPCGCISFAPLVPLHLTSSFITVSLYATTGIFALTMPDPEHASAGHDTRGDHLRWHQRMAWIHFGGMIAMPILGILTSMPGLVGVNGAGIGEFQTVMRTLHLGVGYITLAALTTAMVFEL